MRPTALMCDGPVFMCDGPAFMCDGPAVATEWRYIGWLVFAGYFPRKSPIISDTFAGRILSIVAHLWKEPHH